VDFAKPIYQLPRQRSHDGVIGATISKAPLQAGAWQPMPHYLLTGAGFSRNWGGWLADEAFEYLLGCPEITPDVRNLLWKHKAQGSGFEGALQELRAAYLQHRDHHTAKPLQLLDQSLIGMFNSMNHSFGEFEPRKHEHMGSQPAMVRDFLCRFDAIFSLNQDTLLEQKYQPSNFLEGSRGRWFGFQSPGFLEENIAGQPYARPGMFRPADPPFTLKERVQPYFKLHGSSNWRALNGSTILIMGQNKGSEIDNSPLLNWYRDQFREMLGQTGAHLMVIGYSFRDDHINQIIVKAVQKGLKLFIIDTRRVDVLDPEGKNMPGGLKHLLQDSIIGASRRYFLPTISTDLVEFKKILRFFPLFP
jgi:hypothetical protein